MFILRTRTKILKMESICIEAGLWSVLPPRSSKSKKLKRRRNSTEGKENHILSRHVLGLYGERFSNLLPQVTFSSHLSKVSFLWHAAISWDHNIVQRTHTVLGPTYFLFLRTLINHLERAHPSEKLFQYPGLPFLSLLSHCPLYFGPMCRWRQIYLEASEAWASGPLICTCLSVS